MVYILLMYTIGIDAKTSDHINQELIFKCLRIAPKTSVAITLKIAVIKLKIKGPALGISISKYS